MHRGAFVLTCLLFAAAPAAAQVMEVHVISFAGREGGTFDLMDLANTEGHPISLTECESGPLVELRFNNVDITRDNLMFFVGSMCTDPNIRNDTTNTTCQALEIDPAPIQRSEVTAFVPAGLLVPPCDEGGSATQTVWALALNNTADDASGVQQNVSFRVAYDFEPPTAPSDVASGGGENMFTVTYTAPSDAESVEIFLDPTGCSGGVVTSTGLTTDPPDASLSIGTFTASTDGTSIPWPDTVPIPGEAAVAVRSVDAAGLEGPLSTPTCVRRYDQVGYWDMMCAGTDPPAYCSGGSGCSVSAPSSHDKGALVLLVLGVIGLVSLRRGWTR